MLVFRRGLVAAAQQRFSTCAALRSLANYKAENEPIFGYLPGSVERKQLEDKIKDYDSKVHEVPIYIGDEEFRTNDVRHQVRPFDHQNPLTKFYYADKDLIQKAIDVSQKAHRAWERTPLEKRAEIFLQAANLVSGKYRMDLMAATMLGQAKTIVQAEIDTACELADFYRFNVQFAMELSKFQPISTKESENSLYFRSLEGFWAAVAPFNFTAISGHLPGAPAFMGNVVLWKPPDTGLLSSYLCYKILREAGVPAGVVNFLPCDGPVFGNVITQSPLLAGINFTGSARTFQLLWSEVAKNLPNYKSFPRIIGECGGKNFHFVHDSADIESVVNGTVRSAFEYGGQKCSACSRIYVPQTKWNVIRDGLVEKTKQLKVGDPKEGDTFFSAVIDDKAFDRIKGYLDYAKSSPNIKVVTGGNCDNSKGYYVEPTIVETTDPKDKLLQEEIFGPVLTVYVYPDKEYRNVLKLIDSTSPYGLTGAVFAQDESVIDEAQDTLRFASGNFYINDKSTGSVVGQQPFGGARKSGTNDKAGGPHYMLKFISPLAVKTTKVPLKDVTYPYMKG